MLLKKIFRQQWYLIHKLNNFCMFCILGKNLFLNLLNVEVILNWHLLYVPDNFHFARIIITNDHTALFSHSALTLRLKCLRCSRLRYRGRSQLGLKAKLTICPYSLYMIYKLGWGWCPRTGGGQWLMNKEYFWPKSNFRPVLGSHRDPQRPQKSQNKLMTALFLFLSPLCLGHPVYRKSTFAIRFLVLDHHKPAWSYCKKRKHKRCCFLCYEL